MKILITGASGFLGSQIASDLMKAGHEITCCVRNTAYTKRLFPTANIISCDFINDTAISDWIRRLEGIEVVINTVGIFYHPNKKIIWKTHFDVPCALFSASLQAGVKKIIQISALGVDKYKLEYAKSKLAADEFLLKLAVPSIILRPSLIYGHGSYGGTSLFRGLAGLPLFIPLPHHGEQELQPIYLPELSQAIVKLAASDPTHSQILNAVSPEKIKLRDILTTLRQWLGFTKAYFFPVPHFFISLFSFFGNLIPNSMMNSSASKMLMQNNVSNADESEKFIQAIGFTPRKFNQGVFSSPSTVQDRWHASLYFVKPLLQYSLAFLWIFTGVCSLWLYPRASSYALLSAVGIESSLQPFFLCFAATLNMAIGLALLCHVQIKKMCLFQALLILIYSFIILLKLPSFWLHPFGPLTKNIPLLVSIYILYILENNR